MTDKGVTKYLKLPFQFSAEKLQQELRSLTTDWIPHFNTQGYTGNWHSIALYAIGGDESNIMALNNDSLRIVETFLMNQAKYFREVVETFNFPLLTVRLLRLGAGAFIKPHRDYNLGYEDGTFRIHIPILTNAEVNFILDGDQINMLPGECWYTNVNFIHSVSNNGQTDRIHLVIDGERNDWSDELFFSLVPKKRLLPNRNVEYPPETIKSMIPELKRIGTPIADQLIKELQASLDKRSNT